VIPQACLCLHRDGWPLTSAGSSPCWGGGPSYNFSRVGQLSPLDRGFLGDAWAPTTTVSGALAHILAELTFVFLRVTFRGCPFIHYAPASSLLCVYNDSRDNSSKPTPSPSLFYSLTHAHRSIGCRNQTQTLAESAARLMYLRVYDSRDNSRKLAPSLSLCYSLTHAHRSIGYRNHTQPLAEDTARLMYLRGLYNSTSKWLTTSLTELMYRLKYV
jgi:hypothetical protein